MASPTARAPVGYAAQGLAYAYAGRPGWNSYAAQPGWSMGSPYGYYVTDLRERCISDTC